MCGIAGLIARAPVPADAIRAATDAIHYRGPDDQGHWTSDDGRVLLGHRRLAIIDLSAAGHQPMESADGRYVTVYNGEIYNHLDLRRDLEAAGLAPNWRGHSDTETLLAAIVAWGTKTALERAAGMFALALWDRQERRLTLARDRFGEKPLYYGWCAAGFAFASELKAIRALPGFANPVDPDAVRLLLGYGAVPAPWSIHRGLFKLEPGTMVSVPATIAETPGDAPLSRAPVAASRHEAFYDYAEVVLDGATRPFASHDEALAALRDALGRAVDRQLVADVPVGTFLSGGIDSTLITALAARGAAGKVKSFSIGFADAGYDEAPFARAIAAHLGTDHHERYVTADDALAVIPKLPRLYDEPFADSSQLPTYLVSRFAREQVTVALSGDAGDELFGGYNRHSAFPRLWRHAGRLPGPVRRLGLGTLAAVPPGWWTRAANAASKTPRPGFFGDKVARTLQVAAGADGFADLVAGFRDGWAGAPAPSAGSTAGYDAARAALYARLAPLAPAAQLMADDALGYLPDLILTKVDRAAMAVSLEGRIPFLDPGVAAVAARVPPASKIAGGTGKRILRDLLYTMVPEALLDRPKAGFAIPVGPWLRGPLRDWAEDLLSPAALSRSGLLEPAPIRALWAEHLAGGREHTERLWSVLMLQAWLADRT